MTKSRKLHVVVVGAGIVGVSVAYHALKSGAQVTIVDRDPGGDKASFGNAGAIAVTEVVPASTPGALWRALRWTVDPLGPLAIRPAHMLRLIPWLTRFARSGAPQEVERISRALAALNSRAYDDLIPMLRETGLLNEFSRSGAMTVYETEEGFRRDAAEWALKRSLGINFEEISGQEARHFEPALTRAIGPAIYTPQWSQISDPRLFVQRLQEWLLRQGVVIQSGDVVGIISESGSSPSLQLAQGDPLSADKVVIAAGAWSGRLSRILNDRVLLESERGYNATLHNPGVSLTRALIFAEHKFVATPIGGGLRIGGAAEFGGLNAAANFKRSAVLVELARRYLPNLRTEASSSWAGHRPATPDSLPVIGPSRGHPNVLYAFGHGHLGLTQAATTGRLIADLIAGQPSPIDMSPYGIDRFN